MKKDMPLEGLRWSRDSGSALYDTPQNGRSRTGWGGTFAYLAASLMEQATRTNFLCLLKISIFFCFISFVLN